MTSPIDVNVTNVSASANANANTTRSVPSIVDSVILSVFPKVSTHLKHNATTHQSLLVPTETAFHVPIPEPLKELAEAAGIYSHDVDVAMAPQLFPHDKLIVALSISFNRFTIKYPNETLYSRIFWSLTLGYLAFMFNTSHNNYCILICIHLFSFHQYLFQLMVANGSNSNTNEEGRGKRSRGKDTKVRIKGIIYNMNVIHVILSFLH